MIVLEFIDGTTREYSNDTMLIGIRDSNYQRPIKATVSGDIADDVLHRVKLSLHASPKYNTCVEYVPA